MTYVHRKPLGLTGQPLGRRLLDMVELGVDRFRSIKEFGAAAAAVQIGNKVRAPVHRRTLTACVRAPGGQLGIGRGRGRHAVWRSRSDGRSARNVSCSLKFAY